MEHVLQMKFLRDNLCACDLHLFAIRFIIIANKCRGNYCVTDFHIHKSADFRQTFLSENQQFSIKKTNVESAPDYSNIVGRFFHILEWSLLVPLVDVKEALFLLSAFLLHSLRLPWGHFHYSLQTNREAAPSQFRHPIDRCRRRNPV